MAESNIERQLSAAAREARRLRDRLRLLREIERTVTRQGLAREGRLIERALKTAGLA